MRRSITPLVAMAVVVICVLVAVHHAGVLSSGLDRAIAVTLLGFVMLSLRLALSWNNRPVVTDAREDAELGKLRVGVVVPFFNEDPKLLRRTLDSIAVQTRLPQVVWVVDDGSATHDGLETAHAWAAEMPEDVAVKVLRKANGGKRSAQAVAFADPSIDVYVTVDSDTVLDADAIREGLKPFARRGVQAVAGIVLGSNWRRNLLTRIIDLECTSSFLVDKASTSVVKSVMVASGALAFYRGEMVRQSRESYLSQRFMGRAVAVGDDRRLTSHALMQGHVVFQETSVAYTAHPERFTHLIRQRIRWSMSFYINAMWLLPRISMRRPAFWIILWQAASLIFFTGVVLVLVLWRPLAGSGAPWAYFLYVTGLSYVRLARYPTLRRNDATLGNQLRIFLLSPLVMGYALCLLLPLRLTALVRMRNQSWGTRTTVEVTA